LGGEVFKAFRRLEDLNGWDTILWKDYKIHLRNLLQDPVTCAATLAQRFNDAAQRLSQTVMQFVNYMDNLKDEMSPFFNEYRRLNLLGKFMLEISYALNNYQVIPDT
jgi:hypothetical protein